MHLVENLAARHRKPISRLCRFLGPKAKVDPKSVIEKAVVVRPIVFLVHYGLGDAFIRLGGRQQDHIKGNRPAHPRVQQLHTLINFGVLLEVVDKPVFHLESADTRDRKHDQTRCDCDHGFTEPLHQVSELQCERFIALLAGQWAAIRNDRHQRGNDRERGAKPQHNARRHHPAKIDDGLEPCDDQRGKGDDGRHRRVEARHQHQSSRTR